MCKFKVFLFSLIAAVFLAGPAQAEITHVKMGTEGAYPPFNNINEEGDLVGFDIDIGNALCDAMGVTCEWVTSDWDGIIPALLAKKFDTITASMSITAEREEKIAFTDKYYTSPVRFIRRKGTDATPESISGAAVGVQSATVSENLVQGKFPGAEIKTYAEQEQANLDLTSGRVDLVAADAFVLIGFVDSEAGNDVEFVGPSYTDTEYLGEGIGIGVRKEDTELLQMLNDAIEQIREDGTYQKINTKHFDFDVYGN
ncbi:MAG: Lysine/arginine/ornithine-binding periplasmic protein [Gammaproteobacteria bacterium]|nr:Lysine/arginine/ornithine-binding periplasmic protein [Gammaproteobacteria bacterium]